MQYYTRIITVATKSYKFSVREIYSNLGIIVEKNGALNSWIHTYVHTYMIGHYNPSVRIIELVSHTTNVVCVNFVH